MRDVLWIALGGALGAVARYGASYGVHRWLGHAFPYGTLAVNVLGCFLLGVLAQLTQALPQLPLAVRLGLATGFLGALTTFSTFGYETIRCLQDQGWTVALSNIGLNVALGLLAVLLGIQTGRWLPF